MYIVAVISLLQIILMNECLGHPVALNGANGISNGNAVLQNNASPTFKATFTPVINGALSNNVLPVSEVANSMTNVGKTHFNAEMIMPNNANVQFTPVITEVAPNLQVGDITIGGDLPIGGTIKVVGCFPVYGMIEVDGNLPSTGTAVLSGNEANKCVSK